MAARTGTVRGVILAGGGATRYGGRPKGLETVGGVRILDRLVESFTSALGTLPLLVANDPGAGSWRRDLPVVADERPGLGSLGGIYTAVVRGPAPVVVCAWDMPFVPPALIRCLADGLADRDACLPESGGAGEWSRCAPPTVRPVGPPSSGPWPGRTAGRSPSIGT